MAYTKFIVLVRFTDKSVRLFEDLVAIDTDAALADIKEAYGDFEALHISANGAA